MKVLIVCSCTRGKISGPYIEEQVESLRAIGLEVDYFLIKGKGAGAYIISYWYYLKKIWKSDYNLIHAHYGFSGLMASCQFLKPVVTTFHGSDINIRSNRRLSWLAYKLSKFSIFVNEDLAEKIGAKKKYAVVPCGTNVSIFCPLEKEICREKLNLPKNVTIALFPAGFDEYIKNYPLAQAVCSGIANLILVELKGYTREEVNLLLNASDFLIMTSFSEGSPQIIKEAMACNCPIITTDVGDISSRLKEVEGCYITNFDKNEIKNKIQMFLKLDTFRTNGRKLLFKDKLDMNSVADKILNIYHHLI